MDEREEALTIMRRMEPLILQLVRDVAEIKGRIADMPTGRDFGHLEGQVSQIGQRIADINARLPVPVGSTPPKPAA